MQHYAALLEAAETKARGSQIRSQLNQTIGSQHEATPHDHSSEAGNVDASMLHCMTFQPHGWTDGTPQQLRHDHAII